MQRVFVCLAEQPYNFLDPRPHVEGLRIDNNDRTGEPLS